ncbi:MAG: Alkaline phosphatase [Bacteroidetes bacterium]|nr:Alkaline phosphatase [Bacteroidota bacterium]
MSIAGITSSMLKSAQNPHDIQAAELTGYRVSAKAILTGSMPHALISGILFVLFLLQRSESPTNWDSMKPLIRLFPLAIVCFLAAVILSTASAGIATHPRLVVVITLDQFPHEYLARFEKHFGPGGFRYMMNGAVFTNATYKHASTSTGPGHAVILSGTYARSNGIVTNSWYDRSQRRRVYCVEDRSAQLLGSSGEGRSPANFTGLTYGDMLRINTAFRSKVISLSNKDRAAVLPGGKFANLVLWMKDSVFVSSTYYAAALPPWVQTFNASGKINSYFGAVWEKSLPASAYEDVDRDDAPYEEGGDGLGRTFPHPIRGKDALSITPSYYSALLSSPFGAEVLAALAKQTVTAERLGKRGVTDLLSVSFSSPDYVGHSFGPYSQEMLDMAVRMDRILSDFFAFLNREVGREQCLFVLTSDHGVSPIPQFLKAHSSAPVIKHFSAATIVAAIESVLTARFPRAQKDSWIEHRSGGSLFLSQPALAAASVTAEQAGRVVCDLLLSRPEISCAFTREQIRALTPTSMLERRIQNSFFETRSGDVVFSIRPLWTEGEDEPGATHGAPVESDAHVALMFRGTGVRPGLYHGEASPADIAPTLSTLTGVEFTPTLEGRVLTEAIGAFEPGKKSDVTGK